MEDVWDAVAKYDPEEDLEVQFCQRVRSLEGATVPNGQKYEEWLKDK